MTVMLTCSDANALIVRTIDDARLSGGERLALRRHLTSCARCRREYETQHDVRRLLVLHIQDPLPAGFDERLSARLARTSRSLPADTPRWHEVDDVWRRGMRCRAWALRLAPLAAAVMLIVAGTSVRDDAPLPSAPASISVSGKASEEPRTFTTIVLPRHDRTSRRHRPPSVSARDEDVALAPAPRPADDGVAESGTAVEHASRAAQEVPAPSAAGTAFEPRAQQRERVATRTDDAGDADDDAGREHAASQRPGILPRPATPFPQARPAMPAPPAVLPDRSIPPREGGR
jgi:hypothetical protein